jgi:hypothetical protein
MEIITAPSLKGFHYEFDETDHHQRLKKNHPRVHLSIIAEDSDSQALKEVGAGTLHSCIKSEFDDAQWKELAPVSERVLGELAMELFGSELQDDPCDPKWDYLRSSVPQQLIYRFCSRLTPMHLIPQFRRIEDAENYTFGGQGIARLLDEWQTPPVGKEHLELRFNRLQAFVREILGRPNASISVTRPDMKLVFSDELRLLLESHGTGVHQLIILAIAVLSEDNVLFGIEEPEIHLHPVLQRRFLQFLLRETTNRYIITTHSSALIAPSDEVDVIHLKMVDGVTIPTRVDTDANALAVLEDLGVRASDLLQANSVIWVEGPSDRIYLNRWLELMDPTLREGVDYAIMFYGGRLLSHLSLEREDTEVNGFIKLLRINQRSAILIDSDRGTTSDTINETKQRIQTECISNQLHAWLTDGREIENYLTKECVGAALVEHGAKDASMSIGLFERFENCMQKACGKSFKPSWAYDDHKPAWAHRFVKHLTRDQITGDLETQLNGLITFIKPR